MYTKFSCVHRLFPGTLSGLSFLTPAGLKLCMEVGAIQLRLSFDI